MRGAITRSTETRTDLILDIVERRDDSAIRDFVDVVMKSVRNDAGRTPSNQKKNLDYAAKVIRWIDEGTKLLSHPPEGFNEFTLFAPEDREFLPWLKATRGWATVYEALQNADKRWDKLRAQLDVQLSMLRDRCKWISKHKFGEHGGASYQQERAARAALMVVLKCGIAATYSNTNSIYCRVAAVFYEELTGKVDKEIRRACEREARAPDRARFALEIAELPGLAGSVRRIHTEN